MYNINKYIINILFYFILLFILSIGFFTNLYHHDEALIEVILTNYMSNGEFNFALDSETSLTFMRPYFYLLSLLTDNFLSPFSYLILRIPNLIISFLSLVIFHKIILYTGEKRSYFIFPSLAIFCYYIISFSGGLTLRADIIVFFIILTTLFSYLKYIKTKNESYLIFSFLLCSMVVAVHHLMVFPFLINLHIIIKNLKKFSTSKFIYLLILTLIFAPISFYLLLWGDSILAFVHNLFEANKNLNGSFLKNFYAEFIDLARVKHLIYYHAKFGLVIFSAFITIICSFVIKILTKDRNYIDIYYYMIFGLIFLASIPDKWLHHYSIIIPFVIFLLIDSLNIINLFFRDKAHKRLKNFIKIMILLYSVFIMLFLLIDVWRNIYYNNYIQKFFNENKPFKTLYILKNNELNNSNDLLMKINEYIKDKYFLMEPSIFPFLNNSKFSTKDMYINEVIADYKFINKLTQENCEDSQLYQNPNELMKIADIKTNEISFYRYKYILCKIKK